MRKKSTWIIIISIVLALAVALTLLSAASCKGNSKKTSTDDVSDTDTVDNTDEEYIDDEEVIEDDDSWDDGDWEDDSWGEEEDNYEEPVQIAELKVFNGAAPINTQYRGLSGSVYHAYGFMKDDITGRVYTDEMMNIELTRLQESGVRYCRTRYNSAWCWNNGAGWNWESRRMNYFYDYAKALQERNISIVLSVGWHLGVIVDQGSASIGEVKYLWDSSMPDRYGETVGYDFSGLSDAYKNYATASLRYGYWYAETLKQCRARGVNNISYLLYFTEPSYSTPEQLEGPHAAEYLFICDTIKNKLAKEGVANMAKHVGPNQAFGYREDKGLLRYVLERKPDLFDVYTSHYYPESGDITNNVYYDQIKPMFDSYLKPLKDVKVYQKKEFWVDEFYCRSTDLPLGTDSPWAGLQTVVGAITAQQAGINNISLWQIFDQLWTDQSNTGGEFVNGIHACGSTPSLFVSSIPRSQYYSVSLFARYNGYKNGKAYLTNQIENQESIDGNAYLHIGAAQLEDGNWTITVVNAGADDATFTVNFDKAINKTLYRHVNQVTTNIPSTAAHLADADKTYANVTNRFIDTLPGGSVAIYTSVKG